MKLLDIFKAGTELIVSMGVGSIVGNAIKMTHDPEAGRIRKIAIGIGGYVLSSMISEQATQHADKKIDAIYERAVKIFGGDVEETVVDVVIMDDTGEGEPTEIASFSGIVKSKPADKPADKE